MENKEEIQHALDNWDDKNHIIGFELKVINSCLGYDSYNLDYSEREEFIKKLNLVAVKFDEKYASVYLNPMYISKNILRLEKESKEARAVIYQNRKEILAYARALSK